MGTIVARKRADGTAGYTAQILLKREGKIVHREARTFDRRQAAAAWLEKREKELRKPGGIEKAKTPSATLDTVIGQYIKEARKDIGRTKAQVLAAIRRSDLAEMECEDIRSSHIVTYAQSLAKTVQPQTVGNYLSHLAAIFAIARPAWGYALNQQAMKDALAVAKRMGITSKSRKRDRRPTIAELDKLMAFFRDRHKRRPSSLPMHTVIPFAIFSTRRLSEIVRITRTDLDADGSRVLVRDMKNPGDKIGNDIWCDLPREALEIARAQPQSKDGRLFPYSEDAISAGFTRAVAQLGIQDLHFHDLRHEGVSRLFELGWSIPKVATVSGHRSWESLKRYSHIRQTGDKFHEWEQGG